MRAYWKLTLAGLKEVVREPTTLFWNFVFPVLFVAAFGLVFGRDGTHSFNIGLVSASSSGIEEEIKSALAAVPVFKLHSGDLDTEMQALRKGSRRAVIVIAPDRVSVQPTAAYLQIDVYYDPAEQTASQVILPIVRQVVDDVSRQVSGQPAPYRLENHPISAKNLRPIDYTTPGILAYSIMQLGLFGALPMIILRENRVLKRLRATPLSRRTMVAAQVTTRVLVAGAQLAVILGFARAVFGVETGNNWPLLIGIVILGALTFVSMGYAVSALARTQEGVMPIVQIISFPMLFLSGIFFPLEFVSSFLRHIATLLPLTFLADALRQVTIHATPAYPLGIDLAVLSGWLIVSLVIAIRFFRWA